MKNYDVLNELVPKTQELHRAIFDKGYEQGAKDIIYGHLVCNKCLSNDQCDCKLNFCPNCGARMDEAQESENKQDEK